MQLTNEEMYLLSHQNGMCTFKHSGLYILYTKNNWEEVKEFCKPFKIKRSKANLKEGSGIIELPTGSKIFRYGMILVCLENNQILILTLDEFLSLFDIEL